MRKILFFVVSFFGLSTNAQSLEDKNMAFPNVSLAKIIIKQNYGNATKVNLPIKAKIVRLLKYADINEDNNKNDFVINITIDGKAVGDKYSYYGLGSGSVRYTSAEVNGNFTFESNTGLKVINRFRCKSSPPRNISLGTYLSPNDAPFINAIENPDFYHAFIKSVYQISGIEPVILALKDNNKFVREAAAQVLGETDSRAVKYLIIALKDSYSGVRYSAAEALGSIKDTLSIDALKLSLKDPDYSTRMASAFSLGRMNDPRVIEPLVLAIKNDVFRASIALESITNPEAFEQLVIALNDEDKRVKVPVVAALGSINDPRSVEPIVLAMKDPDADVVFAAKKALRSINNPKAVEQLILASRDLNNSKYYHTSKSYAALEALKSISDPLAIEQFIIALNDQDDLVREIAANALGNMDDQRAIEPLFLALNDKESNVQFAAELALLKIKNLISFERLILALSDEKKEVKVMAIKILDLDTTNDFRAVEPLILLLKDESVSVSDRAAAALKKINDPRTFETLILYYIRRAEILNTTKVLDEIDPNWKTYSSVKNCVPLLISDLQNRDRDVRYAAAKSLKLITSNDFGVDHNAWMAWWKKNKKIYK